MLVRTLEVIFQRPLRLLILFVLLPLLCLGIVYYVVPHTYKSTATLWAFHPFEISDLTTTTNFNPPTPAASQANTLSELLQSRAFALSVASEANLASTLDRSTLSNSQRRDDTLFQDISQNVLVQTLGNNVFDISYTNRNPQVAQQVVAAVIHDYNEKIQPLFIVQAQNLINTYQSQLAQANKAAQTAAVAEANYVAANPNLTNPNIPGATLQSDPHYALLQEQTQQAELTAQDIQTHLDNIKQDIAAQGVTADSFFKVLDNPVETNLPESRSRDLIIAGGIGLFVAIMACALYIVMMVRRDHAIYTTRDLQTVTTYPVIMLVPRLSSRTVPMLIKEIDEA